MVLKKEKYGKACKEHMTSELLSRFEGNTNFFITNYMGLSNAEIELLRRSLRKSSSSYFVVKNSILKVIFDKLKLKTMEPLIEGGVGISLSGMDFLSTSKTLVGFTKEHEKLKIKGAYLDGKNIPPEKIRELASLPPRDVLLARVVGGIKSPITGFVNTLGGLLRKFVYVVEAIKKTKS